MNTLAPTDRERAADRVHRWQCKYHRWARENEDAVFDDVFNLVCEHATLLTAWQLVKTNRGSRTPGVDNVTREQIEAEGVTAFLTSLRAQLKDRSYRPQPVRERAIPKRGGKVRKLGIPTLADRIVQMALKLVLEPIFEADFSPHSYGFRPGRRAHDAVAQVVFLINPSRSYEWVVEGDIQDCFGQIRHGRLIQQVRRRVTDKRVIDLVRAFLTAGIMREHELATTTKGTPQGGIISPLLANIALSDLDSFVDGPWRNRTTWQRHVHRASGRPTFRIVRYADDFVILVHGHKGDARQIKRKTARFLREQLGLTLSPEKTRITHVDDGFDFLGFAIRRIHRPNRKPAAIVYPSKNALLGVMATLRQLTSCQTQNMTLDELIHNLNRVLVGWTGYYRLAASSRTFGYLSHFLWWRIVRWLRRKHPRMTWKHIRREYWNDKWTSPNGTMPAWPHKVPVRRYTYRGARIPTPWPA